MLGQRGVLLKTIVKDDGLSWDTSTQKFWSVCLSVCLSVCRLVCLSPGTALLYAFSVCLLFKNPATSAEPTNIALVSAFILVRSID